MNELRVYIGWDAREPRAAEVAASSLRAVSGLDAEFLRVDRLTAAGLLWRSEDHRGQHYDLVSHAPVSTEFAASRFLTPILCQSGPALFVDGDVVFLRDPRDMVALTCYAVSVVKHCYQPAAGLKMDGQAQTQYPRKNWSSVMLFNCDHPANRRLSLWDVNSRPGRDLHAFYWLHDSEIGELDPCWNWLVNEPTGGAGPGSDKIRADNAAIAHFTRGGPWLEGWAPMPHDDIWEKAAA